MSNVTVGDKCRSILSRMLSDSESESVRSGIGAFDGRVVEHGEKGEAHGVEVASECCGRDPEMRYAYLGSSHWGQRVDRDSDEEDSLDEEDDIEEDFVEDGEVPMSKDLYALHGIFLMKEEEYSEAEVYLDEAIEYHRGRKGEDDVKKLLLSLSSIVKCLYELDRVDAAWPYLEEATRIAPKSPLLYRDVSVYYYRKGEYAKAIDALEKYGEYGGEKVESYYFRLGMSYLKSGNSQKAKEIFLSAGDIRVETSGLNAQLGLIFLQEGKGKLAEKYMVRAKQGFKESGRLSIVSKGNRIADTDIALIAFTAESWKLAYEYCKRALRRDAGNRELLNMRDECEKVLGKDKETRMRELEDALFE